jgi:hypothetical protein
MPLNQINATGLVPANAKATGQPTAGGGFQTDQWISELHAPYYTLAYSGMAFNASNVAAQAVSVALTTTYTGLCISNPLGNTKNLVLLGAGYALTVAPAAIASLHLIAGYSATTAVAHTTPLAAPGIQNGLIGTGPSATAKADSAATIVNPGYLIPLMGGFTAAALPSSPLAWIDLKGMFVVPPGGWVALGALTAVTGFGGFVWAEVPV